MLTACSIKGLKNMRVNLKRFGMKCAKNHETSRAPPELYLKYL